jgi:hypothetical protein
MLSSERSETGLRLGLIILGTVALGFLGVFLFGPAAERETKAPPQTEAPIALLDVLTDAPTRRAVEALSASATGTAARLDAAAKRAIADGAEADALSKLLLEALFAQFQDQAAYLRAADAAGFQTILAGFGAGMRDLKASNSAWCDGAQIADFLTQNEADLVPGLLSEFPYGSPQYDWAMDWMTSFLIVAKNAQDRPRRHPRPGPREEAILQQQGLALGSEQWGLALQIAAFANSEGVSYAKMQEVIAGMDVCDLGIAIETVSDRLPDQVRARIWADLMPELMVGNTPYVMWRVTDYFFIG